MRGIRKYIGRRLTALLLALVIVLTSGYNESLVVNAESHSWGTDVELVGFSSPLYVFNTFYRTDAAGKLAAISGDLSLKSPSEGTDAEFGYNIYIGDYPEYKSSETQDGITGTETNISQTDISIQFNGVSMQDGTTVHINKVNSGNNRVNMFVSAASTLSGLRIENGAILELTLDADTTIGELTIVGNGQLIIHNNGNNCTISSITEVNTEDTSATAAVVLYGNGAGEVKVTENISVSSLSVNKAVLTATNVAVKGDIRVENGAVLNVGNAATEDGTVIKGNIIVDGNITVDSATVKNVSLFGYDSNASGLKTVTLINATLDGVNRIGAGENCVNAAVVLQNDGQGNISNQQQSTEFVCDYKISYNYNGTEVIRVEWPGYYRAMTAVSASGSVNTILGSIIQQESVYTYTALPTEAGGVLTLPVYTQEGYGYEGWLQENSDNPVLVLQGVAGDQVLTAKMAPEAVATSWVLNYERGDYTNPEDELENLPSAVHIGDTVMLTQPYNFGYVFAGWKITTGETRQLDAADTSFQIQLSDLTKDESGNYQLKLEAQWTPDEFNVVLNLDVDVELDNIRIKDKSIAEYVADKEGIIFDADSKNISFNTKVHYGESLQDYFERVDFDYAAFTDANENLKERKRFVAWTYSGAIVNANTLFALGDGGLLKLPANKSLKEYHEELRATNSVFMSLWDTADYKLYFDEVSGWTFWVDGIQLTSTEEGTVITAGKTITMKHAAGDDPTAVNLSEWKIGYTDSTNLFFEIPQQCEYAEGDSEVIFTFTMPTYDIAAAYCGKRTDGEAYTSYGYTIIKEQWKFNLPSITDSEMIYVDLAKSDITFVEGISYAGISGRTGFWYNAIVDAMTPLYAETIDNGDGTSSERYFYCWDFNEPFYITTSEPTQNQLTIINTMTVYLKNVEMVATEAYTKDAVGRKLGNLVMEKQGQSVLADTAAGAWAEYGNIVLDNSAHPVYTTTLYFEGESNTVASIFQSQYRKSNDNKATLVVDGSVLNLGSVWGNLELYFKNLELGQYDNSKYGEYPDNSEYLVWVSCGKSTNGSVDFSKVTLNAPDKRVFSGFAYIKYSNSQVELGSSRHSYSTKLSGSSYVHLLNDSYGYYYGFDVSGSSSLVIEGNFHTNGYTTSGSTINTSGFVIVKGNFFDAGALSISKGTLIANAVGISSSCAIKDQATVITNQLVNMVSLRPSIDSDGEYHFENGTGNAIVAADKNGDDKPFLTFSNNYEATSSYTFSGGNIYLLGYYQVQNGRYDTSICTTSENNPMADIMRLVTPAEEGGRYDVSKLTDEVLSAAVAESSLANSDNQCVMFGNSTYAAGTVYERKVLLSGTNFYAAGHMNFYNETQITGGIIECAGMLSSKHDLTISGGTVTAKEIGNSYNLTGTTADYNTRWKKVAINGGTITADRIGALSYITDADVIPRSTVELSTAISPKTEGKAVEIVHDVYVNYIYDKASNEFVIPEVNPGSMRFVGTLPQAGTCLSDVTDRKLVKDDLTTYSDGLILEQPCLNDQNNTPAQWVTEAVPGAPNLVYIASDTKTYTNAAGAEEYLIKGYDVFNRQALPIYLIRGNYTLAIKDSLGALNSIQVDVESVSIENEISVVPGKEVCLNLKDAEYAGKMVIWYYDDNGILHNAMPTVNGSTVKFLMPVADTEIWITNELALYLDQYDITFTSDGFITAADRSRADSIFTYKGNLTVMQSNTTTRVSPDSGRGKNVVVNTILDENGGTTLATTHQMFFEEGAGSSGVQREITLQQIMQTGTGVHYGIQIADGEKVELLISGAVQLYPILLTANSDLKIIGKTPLPDNGFNTEDTLYMRTNSALSYYLIGNGSQACGDIQIENMQLKLYSGYLAKGTSKSAKNLEIRNCLVDFSWYAYCTIADKMEDVIFEGCDVAIAFRSDTGGSLFVNCTKVSLVDTVFTYNYGGGRHGVTLFYGMEYFEATNSNISMDVNHSKASSAYYEYLYHYQMTKSVILNDSILEIDHRVVLNSLVLNGESSVSFSDGAGYLLCPDIEVNDTSSITADYIVVSGFYYNTGTEAVTEADVYNALITTGNMVLDGNKTLSRIGRVPNGLVLNGGTVNAAEFVGGNVNGKITVNGGVLNAKGIGTSGVLYGYAQYVPVDGSQNYVYQYEKLPGKEAATVIINGGTVNVQEDGYLGGMHTSVRVTGKAAEGENPATTGTVILGNNATLGLTASQESILTNTYMGSGLKESEFPAFGALVIENGAIVKLAASDSDEIIKADINIPYNDIEISGKDTRVQVTNMTARHKSITISDAAASEEDGFTNGYTYQDKKHGTTAVYVSDTISAKNIFIQSGAVVYAGNVYVLVPAGESGTLSVAMTEQEALAYLYVSGGYGASVKSEGTFIPEQYSTSLGNKNLYGSREVKITYVMDVDASAVDQPSNPDGNPRSFTVGQVISEAEGDGAYVKTLEKAVRFGYEASSWYLLGADGTKVNVETIDTRNSSDLTLYVDWTPVNVPFQVVVDPALLNGIDVESEMVGQDVTKNADGSYTYNKVMEIPYHTENLELALNLQQYTMNTRQIIAVAIYDEETDSYTTVNALTEVSKELMTKYLEGVKAYESAVEAGETPKEPAITLKVRSVQQNAHGIWLHLNKTAAGLPIDAAFPTASLEVIQAVNKKTTAIRAYVDYGKQVLTGVGFDVDGELVTAEAKGYNFLGWYANPDDSENQLKADTTVTGSLPEDFYAKWEAKRYVITFDAGEGNLVTVSDEDLANADQSITGTVFYDKELCTVDYEDEEDGTLPTAWRQSYKFVGWGYLPEGETDHSKLEKVTEGTKLNLTRIPVMDEKCGDTEDIALTLYPIYEKVTVTYHTKDTKWLAEGFNEEGTDTGIYKGTVDEVIPLVGYVAVPDKDNDNTYAVFGEITVGGTKYGIVSTKGEYFDKHNNYVSNDYRNTLYKSGYTFKGWTTKAGGTVADVAMTPQYEDLEVWAIWEANSYTLNLYSKDDNDWQYAVVGHNQSEFVEVSVTVGDEVNDVNWPSRSSNDWYVQNTSEGDDKRYLLGFTFHSMDPGSTDAGSTGYATYQQYGTTIDSLTNAGSLFINREYGRNSNGEIIPENYTAGSTFKLPGKEYTDIMGENRQVPDYPADSTIKMYAVYREISLVFVMYAKVDGELISQVVHTTDWKSYSNYPETFKSEKKDEEITAKGLTLLEWKIHTPMLTAETYAEKYYEENVEKLKEDARALGTYDIMVYTLYVAQVTVEDETLLAGNSPLKEAALAQTKAYTMPASMVTGFLNVAVTSNENNLNLIPVTAMMENLYNSTISYNGNTYDPDNTVAIAISLTNLTNGSTTETIDLAQAASFNMKASSGSVIQMTLYHSRVMTEKKTFKLDVKFTFDDNKDSADENVLKNQWVLYDDLTVGLQPSLYDVYYYANLIGRREGKIISKVGFNESTWQRVMTSVSYGGDTLTSVPEVEGYTAVGQWIEADDSFEVLSGGSSIKHGEPLIFDKQAQVNSGKIYLRTDYTINSHKLSAEADVLSNWNVTYAVTGNTEDSSLTDTAATTTIEYGSAVTLSLKDGQKLAPEFIWLSTVEDDSEVLTRLDEVATKLENGAYTFPMPDKDVVLKFNDVQVLYLEEGSIRLDAAGYEQKKASGTVTKIWTGDYIILMDKDDNEDDTVTENILTLEGDLSERSIELGNLNISASDSIALGNQAKAELSVTGSIVAENILVNSGSDLTMNGQDIKKIVSLSPSNGSAAIGGSEGRANGAIELNNLNINMTLVADEYASGIGPGAQNLDDGMGNIQITGSTITVATTTIAGTPSTLSWVGGANVPEVVLMDTSLQDAILENTTERKGYINHLIVNGKSVTLQESSLGTSDYPLMNAVKAEEILTVVGSSIYQLRKNDAYPISAESIEVKNSVIRTVFDGVNPNAEAANGGLYYGVMKLMDQYADVVICNTLILDTHHGNIVMASNGATQTKSDATVFHYEGTSYLLLNEAVANEGEVVPDITANEMNASGAIITGGSQAVSINSFTVGVDVTMNLQNDLLVTGTTSISEGKSLIVNGGNYSISFTGAKPFADNDAVYKQGKGTLNVEQDIDCTLFDIHLSGVTATVKDMIAENLTFTNSTVTATNGDIGSIGKEGCVTKVIITGTSTVSANTIGALGEKNKTFTLVDDDGSTLDTNEWWTGTLVRDHYRIKYMNGGTLYTDESNTLPTSMRTIQTKSDSELKTETDKITDPVNPSIAAFSVWYFTGAEDKKIALSEEDVVGFEQNQGYLTEEDIQYANDTDPDDGTKTLTLNAWHHVTGAVYIKSGRLFEEFSDNYKSVSIQTNGAWTAQVSVKGSVVEGSNYKVCFQDEDGQPYNLPKGTTLTLTVPGTAGDKFYGFTVEQEKVNTVLLNEFKEMGTSNAPALPGGTVGTEFEEIFLLSVDFSGTRIVAASNMKVVFQLDMNGQAVDVGTVTWSVIEYANGNITANEKTVTVETPTDVLLTGNLYLVGIVKKLSDGEYIDFNMPMDSTVTVTGLSSEAVTQFGGNIILMNLGEYSTTGESKTYNWNVNGLDAGSYKVEWNVAVLSDEHVPNVMNHLVQDSWTKTVEFSVTEVIPTLSVKRGNQLGYTFANTEAHTETFYYEGTLGKVVVRKQNVFAKFDKEANGVVVNIDETEKVIKVTFPQGLEAGIYRVTFSLNNDSSEDGDNVYYTFIVE